MKNLRIEIPENLSNANNQNIKKAVNALFTMSMLVHELVLEEQSKCEHTPEKNLDKDSNLISKNCTECGYIEEKPKGMANKICTKCWGEMKFEGNTPGQGGDGASVYECKDCKNIYFSY